MGKRILLCDDELHITKAAEFKLVRAGYEVECACDGEFGWQAIQRVKPDLLITDCQMPRLNGLQLVERIRQQPELQSMPIFMLSGKSMELSHEELARRWDVRAVLGKPFSPRELLTLVEQAIGVAHEPATV
ncbi:MAG: response regulator [Planctomycetes bacterium]|nr:response regulator [Planctomycetota bacterium]